MADSRVLFEFLAKVVSSLPYISIVIPFRNDQYSENALEKFNFSLEVLVRQLEEQAISSEIIIVDWNSPDAARPLIKEIDLNRASSCVSVVVLEIEKSIHRRYRGHQTRNLVGEVAFNVGIRRSRGEFVVGKVSDTFYSKALVNTLAKKNLSAKYVYRVDRVDVVPQFPVPVNWEDHFEKNIIVRKSSPKGAIHTKACGDFLLMSKARWFVIKGFPEVNCVVQHGSDGEALHAAIGAGATQQYLPPEACIYKLSHSGMYGSRVSTVNSEKNLLKIALLGDEDRNWLQKFVIILMRLILGLLNLPRTRIATIKTRSVYRYYLVAKLRQFFWGGGFFKSNSWGLRDLPLEKKYVIKAAWEYDHSE